MKQLIKRKDGSYSQRGLWDNIRANRGSGKKPTPEMLRQEKKIKSKSQLGSLYKMPKGTTLSTTAPYNYGNTPYLNKRYGNMTNTKTVGDLAPDLKQRILSSTAGLDYQTNLGKNRVLSGSTQYDLGAPKGNRVGTTTLGYKTTNQEDPNFRANLQYTPKRDFSAGFNLNNDLSVNYRRMKDDQGVLNSVRGTANFAKPFSFQYSQDYRKNQPMINQRISGDVTGKKFKGSMYKNYSQGEGKTYGGSLNKYTGDVTYGASANYGPQGLRDVSANLNTPMYDVSYTKDKLNNQNTVQADFKMGKPVSMSYSRTFAPNQRGTETLGGKLNLKNTQAELTKTLSGPQQGTYSGSLTQKLGPLTLTGTGTKSNQGLQDYNVKANLNLLGPTKDRPNRGTLELSGNYGRSKEGTDTWNKPKYNVGLNYSRAFKKGGKVSVKAGGENHVIYKKTTKQGEGKPGHIMVNHPTMDKGKWDTIDLTSMNKKINTVSEGVAATKKWHKENPYKKDKSYRMGGSKLKQSHLNRYK